MEIGLDIKLKATLLGFPNAKLKVKLKISELQKMCNSKPYSYDIADIVERGVLIGGGKAHLQLIEWREIEDIY